MEMRNWRTRRRKRRRRRMKRGERKGRELVVERGGEGKIERAVKGAEWTRDGKRADRVERRGVEWR